MKRDNRDSVLPRRPGVFARAVLAFDSIWLGIFWIAAIAVYSAIGSAVPPFRQEFELTEFQYFNHWIFAAMIALFCLTLVVTTVRRIPLNLRNLGVLTVHVGLLILCGGSILYFGRKIEGDVWLETPRLRVISVDRVQADPQRAEVGTLALFEGNTWETDMPALGGKHRLEVKSVQHRGMTTAAKVVLSASVGNEAPRTIEMEQVDGKPTFAKLSDRLALWLAPANISEGFYDESTPVLIAAASKHVEVFELPGLPYYRERFVKLDEPILDTHDNPVVSDRASPLWLLEKWRMPIDLLTPDRAVSSDWPITMEIDGYLPYARLDMKPLPGGQELQPIARAKLSAATGEPLEEWLVAEAPSRSLFEIESGPWVEFRWIGEQAALDPSWTQSRSGSHVLDVFVKDKNVRRSYDVQLGQNIPVEGTDYTLRIEELRPSWPLMTAGFENARTPIALVWVETPRQQFQRSVLHRFPQLNQDRDRAGKRVDPQKAIVDENLELVYTDASRDSFTIVGGEKLAPTVIHTAPGGKRRVEKLEVGQDFRTESGAALNLTRYIERPRFEQAPVVIPERNRREFGQVRRGESLVRVHMKAKGGSWEKRVWVPFSNYNTEHDMTAPTLVPGVPGLGELQLVYGRAQRQLPAKLTLEWLQTDFYPGRQQPSGWASYFRYQLDGGDVRRAKAFLNNTASIGEWTFFQSQAAGDHESWTVLGVGNRQGVLMMLIGCILVSIGMIYAFTVKPVLVRRRKQTIMRMAAAMNSASDAKSSGGAVSRPTVVSILLAVVLCGLIVPPVRAESREAADLAAISDKIDVEKLGSLATQYSWRYSTVDSWARDAIKTIHGPQQLFGLDPVVAAFELIFNRGAYDGSPIIFIKDRALRVELTAHPVPISDEEQGRIIRTGLISADFLRIPEVADRVQRMAMDTLRKTAMDRLGSAIGHYDNLSATCMMVPSPEGKADAPWFSLAALDEHVHSAAAGQNIFSIYGDLKKKWLARDAAGINQAIADLERILPTLAATNYPGAEKRRAEVSYRRLGLLRYAWAAYIIAFFISIFALATQFRWVRPVGLFFLVLAVGLHGYDIAMRWYVVGRIPVANMYEAVTSSTWVGAVFGLLLELFLRKRVYMLSAALLGFFALALPELLPTVIDNKLGGMMPILDDIMLRIHTVLIISSYAVITLAFGVANCYLFVAAKRERSALAQGTIGAQAGALACLVLAKMGTLDSVTPTIFISLMTGLVVVGALAAQGLYRMLLGKTAAAVAVGPDPELFPIERNVLSEFDLSHRVLLYTATIALFVGIVLGAIWADYSWGRPWGWDPKEVFALNTWLVYAILIHARFVARRRALVTSVLSVVGFAAMQFNWWVVNFYIVGLHSYA